MVSMFTTMIVLLAYLQYIFLAIIFLLSLYFYRNNNKLALRQLPFFGILPEVLLDLHQFHDKLTKILKTRNGTILVNYWMAQHNLLLTSDPANVHYMLTANFSRYPKGSAWRKRFDIFGHGLFNSDFEEWKHQRKTARDFLNDTKFQQLSEKMIPDIIEKGLIPVLEHVSKQGVVVDLQDLFKRYAFDFASTIATGCNPNSLSIGFPEVPFSKALDDACEAIFFRYIAPESLWKLQRWFGIGKEKIYKEGWKIMDDFCAQHTLIRQQKLSKAAMTTKEEEESFNVLNLYLTGNEIIQWTGTDENVIRDNVVGMIFAGEDTTSTALTWFFWLISKNPFAEIKIREELRQNLAQKEVNRDRLLFKLDDLSKLVYLHAALCESLRLFPPIPYESRTPIQPDRLPSGHKVNQKTIVLICTYAMGRMESVWGEDCHEFKPERWMTEDGGIKHEPPHKFFSFNTRPRMCPGKEIAFTLMKALTATIMHNYDVQILESPPVIPSLSISLRMKHGLMARVKSRSHEP